MIPDLSYLLDRGELGITPGYELAFLSEDEQRIVARVIGPAKRSPTLAQATAIKEASKVSQKQGGLTEQMVREIIFGPKKPADRRVILSNEQLQAYFPEDCTPEMMKKGVLKIMQEWAAEHTNQEGGSEE